MCKVFVAHGRAWVRLGRCGELVLRRGVCMGWPSRSLMGVVPDGHTKRFIARGDHWAGRLGAHVPARPFVDLPGPCMA